MSVCATTGVHFLHVQIKQDCNQLMCSVVDVRPLTSDPSFFQRFNNYYELQKIRHSFLFFGDVAQGMLAIKIIASGIRVCNCV